MRGTGDSQPLHEKNFENGSKFANDHVLKTRIFNNSFHVTKQKKQKTKV